ncbi:ABC transporter ATP-binding protein [Vallitalea longa]|uniref:ABC transporter ATP-binding protein n=1 Tax=Vallitalea longa TaxID=2936439 RepID=A0A9W5YEN9_9FIRM|nr:ABC transporter ATP-binding protein [Vallitalea longa]GKX31296.1 ABC transporter ATP-binding protein [Vallitalea longa]
MEMLKTIGLKKYFVGKEYTVKAVDDINLKVSKGEFIVIAGPSGSGKTTFLNLIGGLEQPTQGKVLIDNTNINNMDETKRTIFRRRNIGFVFQSYNLVPIINTWENIVLPIELDGRDVDKKYITELMKTLKIYDRKDHLPNALSGGQQQRVAIARALASNPSIILADEPTGNLDSENSEEVLHLLKKTVKSYNQTLILITHDEKIAQEADRILLINDGRIVKESR